MTRIDPARRDAIVRLLEHLLDGLPESGAARPLSTAGFVHDARARETCPDCFGESPARIGCETCGGRGFLERRRRRDPYDTGRHVGALGATEVGREAVRRRDRELVTLERQLAPPKSEADQLAAANASPPAWVLERAALRKAFDFVPLERALEVLRDVDDDAYRAIYAVHVHRWLPQEGAAAAHAERGLAFVDGWMPPAPIEISAPERVVAVSAEERSAAGRDQRIRELHRDDGWSSKRLARTFELSVSQIQRIISGGGS